MRAAVAAREAPAAEAPHAETGGEERPSEEEQPPGAGRGRGLEGTSLRIKGSPEGTVLSCWISADQREGRKRQQL